MQIIQVSTQEIQASFAPTQERILLGDLYQVSDSASSLIAQVYEINSAQNDPSTSIAGLKILFSNIQGNWASWNGEVPSANAVLEQINIENLLANLNNGSHEQFILGGLSQYGNQKLALGKNSFQSTNVIFSDKEQDKIDLTSLLAGEFLNTNEKIVIFDFKGQYSDIETKRLKAGVDYKLPLDFKGIDRIYAKGLEGASVESKAVIEDIFYEVQNYAKTCEAGFIPLSSFKKVVDDTYERMNITQLVLLKNKLLKLGQEGIFANKVEEIESLFETLENNDLVVVDLSGIPQEWHRDFVDNILGQNLTKYNKSFALCLEVDEINMDLQLLNRLCVKGVQSGIKPVLSLGYSYKHFDNLLSLAQNLFMFKPLRNLPESILGIFNYISKLNQKEFIVCGESTKYIPIFANFSLEESYHTQAEVPDYNSLPSHVDEIEPVITMPSVPQEEQFVTSNDEVFEEEISLPQEPIQEESFVEEHSQEVFSEEVYEESTYINEDEEDDEFLDLVEESQEVALEQEDVVEYKEEEFLIEDTDFDSVVEEEFDEDYRQEVQEEISKEVDSLYTNLVEEIQEVESVENKIPIYSATYEGEELQLNLDIQEGDMVRHQKYGTGVVKKIISYGNKNLCSIHFDEVGRRLLDPELAVIEKI